MAETLAHLYWEANVDANDVEFIVVPPREGHSGQVDAHLPHRSTIRSETLRDNVVWILDFDCCGSMTLDEKGVEQVLAAFYKNDPYYPRPGRDGGADQALCKEFKERFLDASAAILGQGTPGGSSACTVGELC